MSYDKNINNLLKSNLDKIELELNTRFSLLKEGMGNGFNKLSTKLKSELLSNLVERWSLSVKQLLSRYTIC